MFKEPIKGLIELIGYVFSGMDATFLFYSLDQNTSIWNVVQTSATGVFRTLAFVLLLYFMAIEFISISDRYTSNQLPDLIKPIGILTIKYGLIVTFINQAVPLLNSFFNGFLSFQNDLNNSLSVVSATSDDLSGLQSLVDDMGFGVQLIAMVVLLIVVLVAYVVSMFAKILAVGRLVQLYIMVAVSPFPIASLTNSEFSQIGKGFLKSFISCCVQGLILVLVLQMIPYLSTLILESGSSVGVVEGIKAVFMMLGTTVVLIAAIFAAVKGSKKLADTICGAM